MIPPENLPRTVVQGIGLGLRAPFARELLARSPEELQWLEVCPENYLHRGGAMVEDLFRLAERWPVVTHGLTLSLGGAEALDRAYLTELRGFIERVKTPWHSEHLCFGAVDGVMLHDLLPMPFTRESVAHLVPRIAEVQDALGLPFAIENLSSYAHLGEADFDEATFLCELLQATGAGLLLDVNNVYVNSVNHGFDARSMIASLPLDKVLQIHVAGHFTTPEGLRIDTHGEVVCEEVLSLLEFTLERTGPVPLLLERDSNIPEFSVLLDELRELSVLHRRVSGPVSP